jgi:hypothetical protein
MVLFVLCIDAASVRSQARMTQAPAVLLDETYRMAKACYYFKDYRVIKQNGVSYVLAAFVAPEAMAPKGSEGISAAPCGKRLPQVRLYKVVNDSTVAVKDSVFLDKASISFALAADFDGSGTTKFVVSSACRPPEGTMAPLLCYSLSIYEVTKEEKLRSVLVVGNVPEHYRRGAPQGVPLEPVVTDNIDKTPYPECLAVDDFFEGDPAFRFDDFPRITLLYTWDVKERVYKHHSDLYPHRFALPVSHDSLSADLSLTHFIEQVMSLAAVGKQEDARHLMDIGLTRERIDHWKAKDPSRAQHIEADRLRAALLTCIERYKLQPQSQRTKSPN